MRGLDFAINDICLAVFTTLAPGAALAYAALACMLLFGRLDARARACLESWLIMPLALATVGLVVSASHIGTPTNALYVLRTIGSSPLATEVFFTVLFLGTAGSYWLACIYLRDMRALRKAWLVASVLTALLFVRGTTLAYAMPTVVTWDTGLSMAILPLSALACMAPITLLTQVCAGCAGSRALRRALAGASLLAAIACCVLMALQNNELAGQRNAFGTAASLVPFYPATIAAYGACLVAANVGALRASRALAAAAAEANGPQSFEGFSPAERKAIAKLALLCLLAYAGTFAARFCFYCFHMTSGVV